MTRASTTVRLAVLVFVGQVVAAALLLVGLGAYSRWQVESDADAAVELLRDGLLEVYARDGLQGLVATVAVRSPRAREPHAIMLLADRDFRPIVGRLSRWPRQVGLQARITAATIYDPRTGRNEAARLRATRLPDGAHLLTGIVTEGNERVLKIVAGGSLAALLVASLLALLTAWASARMFVRVLSEPVAVLIAARHGDFSHRVTVDNGRDAFAVLGLEINAALDELSTAMEELRLATDALAHDLKSPITRLRAALDRVQSAASVEPFDPPLARAAAARAEDEGARLLAMVETALSISRAEAGIGREAFVPVDSAAVLADLVEIYGPLAEDAGRGIVAAIVDAPPLAGQRDLLARAVSNLVDNSLKYGAGTITIAQSVLDSVLTITVADEGQGIAADERAIALRKFGRLDPSRTSSGVGLGLSLVAAVARLHGGEFALGDAEPGLRASLHLPLE